MSFLDSVVHPTQIANSLPGSRDASPLMRILEPSERMIAGIDEICPKSTRFAGLAMRVVFSCMVMLMAVAAVASPWFASDAGAQQTQVLGIRFGIHQTRTRIVVDLNASVPVNTRADSSPRRVVIDLPSVRWNLRASDQSEPKGLATGVRHGPVGDSGSRIVIDTATPVKIVNTMMLPPSGDAEGYRYVVDIAEDKDAGTSKPGVVAAAPARSEAKAPPRRKAEVRSPGPARPFVRVKPRPASPVTADIGDTATTQAPVGATVAPPDVDHTVEDQARAHPEPVNIPSRQASSPPSFIPAPRPGPEPGDPAMAGTGKPLIAIDAGHGGIDPGAIAVSGELEKNITLATARTLARILERTGRYRVLLVRDDDSFIRLRHRVEIAHRAGADMLISLHADSIDDQKFRGTSVYTLSETASDKEAALLASKENKVDIIGGTDLSHHDKLVASILIDLAQRDTNNKSIDLADLLINELGQVTHLVKNTRRYAGFVVLKSPDTPSVLIELGYLSNKTDAAELTRPSHQEKLAHAITQAINRYFSQLHAPL